MGVCVCFRRNWGPQDEEADADVRQALASAPDPDPAPASPATDSSSALKAQTDEQKPGARESVEIVVGSDRAEGNPSGEATAVSATPVPASDEAIAVPEAPATDDAIVVPEASAVKRAGDLLAEGGLLMTGLEGKEKRVRRLELDVKTGTLRWHVPKFLFVGVDEKVALKEARIMSTGKLLKIGVNGRSDFYTFEACDEEEAASVSDCLNSHAQSMKGKAAKGKAEGHGTETAVA